MVAKKKQIPQVLLSETSWCPPVMGDTSGMASVIWVGLFTRSCLHQVEVVKCLVDIFQEGFVISMVHCKNALMATKEVVNPGRANDMKWSLLQTLHNF